MNFTLIKMSSRIFKLYTANLDEDFEFDADHLPDKRPQWVSYLMGIVAELEHDGFKMSGKNKSLELVEFRCLQNQRH